MAGERLGHGFGEVAAPGRGLDEVDLAKPAGLQEPEDVGLDGGPEGFEDVEGQGGTGSLVGVHDPELRVEAYDEAAVCGDGFAEGVAVVEHGVDWVGGDAW